MEAGMRHRIILPAVLIAISSAGAQTTTAPDALAEGRRIEAEMKKLQEGPGVKEIFELSKKIDELRSKSSREMNALYNQIGKLQESAAYKEYEEKFNALSAKLNAASEADRKKLAEAARQLYQSRHAELQKLAVRDLPGARALGLDVLSYPRVDGSTSTQPLAAIVAARVLGVSYEWAYPEPTGWMYTRAPGIPPRFDMMPGGADSRYYPGDMDLDIAASRTYAAGNTPREERIAKIINGLMAKNSNTHDAYVHLIDGECDINLTARPPSADESKAAQEKKVEIELIPIATDALVFIVHQDNPVKNLTLEQLKGIYQRTITRWKEVGGTELAIRPFLREPNSGSRELFDTLFFRTPTDEAYQRATGELYAGSMGGPYNRVTREPEGIGYSVYYYEHFMALSPYTRNLAINGIEPTPGTLADGKYPLASPVYAAVRKSDAPDSAGRKLAAYLISPEGQALVRESGYVPAKRAGQ
jgi:phosphate transport system substrate-binding protein